jgi:hypothetical protein
VKTVTTVLLVYAILVIASFGFWVRYAVSKSRLTRGATGNVHLSADAQQFKHDAKKMTDNATEPAGRAVDRDKAERQSGDTVNANDL